MDIFDSSTLQPEMQHKLELLSTTKEDIVKAGIAKLKWYANGKLKDIYVQMYNDAMKIIDDFSFFRAFTTDLDSETDEVILRALRQIIYLANKKKHDYPGNEWNFMVMVYTILRYDDLMVSHKDDEIYKDLPEFRRQYGLRRTSADIAMMYFDRTDKLLRNHQTIWFRYIDNNWMYTVAVPTKGQGRLFYEAIDDDTVE